VLSFGRFVDFREDYHGKAINYFFQHMIKTINKKIISETSNEYHFTCNFTNKSDVIENIDPGQMMFLCAILHNLNLKPWLLAIIKILMDNFKLQFEEIKSHGKDDRFKMTVFIK
jgi:hypothetical protein